MPSTLRRTLRTLPVVLLALGLGSPPRAQPLPIPLVPGPEVLILPLMLLLMPLLIGQSKRDESAVRELEGRQDWAKLIALATRRIAENPGNTDSTHWHLARAHALQMAGRCADAIADYALVFETLSGPGSSPTEATLAVATGLNLGQCQMSEWQLPAAAQTMRQLARIAPDRWEPDYNLGVIQALQGDLDGARAAQGRLQPNHPAVAERLAAYIAALANPPASEAERALADAWRTPAAPRVRPGARPGLLTANSLSIGHFELVLPPGPWLLVSASERVVKGGNRAPTSLDVAVPVVTGTAFSLAGLQLQAAVSFSANPSQAFGIGAWMVDDDCAVRDALHVQRFGRNLWRPECLYVRIVDPASAPPGSRLGQTLRAAQGTGAVLPPVGYELHYSRFGLGWLVSATWLLPLTALPGDIAAVQWAQSLAEAMRPMADGQGGPVAVPAFGRPAGITAPAPGTAPAPPPAAAAPPAPSSRAP